MRRLVFAFLMILPAAGAAHAQSQRVRDSRSAAALKEALALLAKEAETLKREQNPPGAAADFSRRFEKEISATDVLSAIARPAHRDPFTDAYIRWQLTSFDPDPSTLEERQFLNMLGSMPALLPNPRSAPDLIETFRKAEKAGPLPAADFARLRNASEELDRRTELVAAFNAPAEQLRDWLMQKSGDQGPRRLQCLIERAAATITAGWPSREIKSSIGKTFKSAASDLTLTDRHKQIIAEQTRKLTGLKGSAIDHITFLNDGTVNATFTSPAINKNDVEKWVKSLGI